MVAVAAALAAVLLASSFSPAHAASSKTYQPPYEMGPAGGDQYNTVYRDPDTGEMGIGRVFPGGSPVVGCYPEPSAGWATFQVGHKASSRTSKVTLTFDRVLDQYSWVTLGVRSGRRWLGVKKLQGPGMMQGQSLSLKLAKRPKTGERLRIEFGLQLGDACPQAGAAVAEFFSVRVDS